MTHDDVWKAPLGARQGEVTAVTLICQAVRLHSRPHIDLQRVAGALCCS
ncbi:putative leader peptide [Streptomyces sp. NPDC005820]